MRLVRASRLDERRLGPAAPPQLTYGPAYDASSGTSHVMTLPSYLPNDYLILMAGWDDSADTASVTGWTQVYQDAISTDAWCLFIRRANGTEGTTVTMTLSASEGVSGLTAMVRGANTFAANSLSSGGSGTQPNPDSLASPKPGAAVLWVPGYACSGNINHFQYSPTTVGTQMIGPADDGANRGVNGRLGVAGPNFATSFDPGAFECTTDTHGWDAFTMAFCP